MATVANVLDTAYNLSREDFLIVDGLVTSFRENVLAINAAYEASINGQRLLRMYSPPSDWDESRQHYDYYLEEINACEFIAEELEVENNTIMTYLSTLDSKLLVWFMLPA